MPAVPNQSADQIAETVNLGRAAQIALNVTRGVIEEMTTEIMENAVAAQRAGELDGVRAQVAWGKISAIWGLQETLENRVTLGEAAALTLVESRGGQPA